MECNDYVKDVLKAKKVRPDNDEKASMYYKIISDSMNVTSVKVIILPLRYILSFFPPF